MYILYDNRDKQQDCFNFIFRWEKSTGNLNIQAKKS